MADPVDDTVARNRWLLINLARVGGVALTVFGLLVANRSVTVAPQVAGYAMILVGLLGAYIVPRVLSRKWRSPDA